MFLVYDYQSYSVAQQTPLTRNPYFFAQSLICQPLPIRAILDFEENPQVIRAILVIGHFCQNIWHLQSPAAAERNSFGPANVCFRNQDAKFYLKMEICFIYRWEIFSIVSALSEPYCRLKLTGLTSQNSIFGIRLEFSLILKISSTSKRDTKMTATSRSIRFILGDGSGLGHVAAKGRIP